MAITITQEPTSPNIANSNLVYTCTSTQVTQPQFQFVVDIKDESGTLIQRIKQQPNPSSKGVFDFGNIIPSQLGPTDTIWDTATVAANTACSNDFKVYFGEEYGTSVSSSVTLYNGAGSPGAPNVTGSLYYTMIDGVLSPNQLVNWNWNSSSFYDEEDAMDDVTFTHQFGLTLFGTQSIRLGDYHTISILRGNLNGAANNNTFAQDVFAAIYRQYDATGSLLSSDTIYDTTTGLRTTSTQDWATVYNLQDETTRLTHWPAGPQNMDDAGITLDPNLAYYTVTLYAQGTDRAVNENAVWGTYRFNITDANCGYTGVRFAYKNTYGVWDYFNFGLAESTQSNVSRQEYKQSFVNFSSTGTTVTYDKQRRGKNNYYNDVQKIRTANSDYLTQEDANNLRELFFSTDVYAQTAAGEYWPVVILNASITEKTNPRSQKLFRYTVEYQYANDQRPRL